MSAALALTGVRLLIARLVADEPLTLYEIARALGRKSGSISGVVHRMTRDGLLVADPDPPVRGTQFRLNPLYLGLLEDEMADDSAPGTIVPSQWVVFVDAADRRAFYGVMAKASVAGSVAWVADVDGRGGRMLALRSDADELDVERLALAFEDAGLIARTGRFGEPMAGDEVRRFASSRGTSVRR